MNVSKLTLTLCMYFGLAAPVLASYDAAYIALQKKDYSTAIVLLQEAAALNDPKALNALGSVYLGGFGVQKDEAQALKWFEKGAQAGNALSMNTLVQAYAQGLHSAPKDILRARAWAEKSAQSGNAEGQYLYYLTVLHGPEWSYRDSAGKADAQKYSALASRSIDERDIDRKAYTMLALSAGQGNLDAQVSVIASLLDKNGPGIKDRALALIGAAPPTLAEKLQSVKQSLQAHKAYGESYSTLSTFNDVVKVILPVALLKAKLQGSNVCDAAKDVELVKFSVSRPLSSAQYLAVDAKPLRDFYLVKGNWQESWDLRVCGVEVTVPVEFQADGFGGAYFQAKG